jgi:hypothetical protein
MSGRIRDLPTIRIRSLLTRLPVAVVVLITSSAGRIFARRRSR